ncbi:Zinc finger CCCH domain-containing protein [Ancistrocladus abbreviatus]
MHARDFNLGHGPRIVFYKFFLHNYVSRIEPNVCEFPQYHGILHVGRVASAGQVDAAAAAHYLHQVGIEENHDELISEFETDEFRMICFKIKRCHINRTKTVQSVPMPKYKAPCKFNYVAISWPDYRAGKCPKAELCEFTHGVFEYWLHPARYRTRSSVHALLALSVKEKFVSLLTRIVSSGPRPGIDSAGHTQLDPIVVAKMVLTIEINEYAVGGGGRAGRLGLGCQVLRWLCRALRWVHRQCCRLHGRGRR